MTLIQTPDALPILPPSPLVGRDALLQHMNQTLSLSQAILLYGAPGVGKRAVAAAFASRYLQIGGQVLWLAGDDLPSLVAQIQRDYDATGEVGDLLQQRKPLIVLLTSPRTASQFFWNHSTTGKAPVLVVHETAADGPWEPLLVRRLDEDASRQLFLEIARVPSSHAVNNLITLLDGHPLLIRLTAWHIAQQTITVHKLLEMLQASNENPEQRIMTMIGVLFRLLDQASQGLLLTIGAGFANGFTAELIGRTLGTSAQATRQFCQLLLGRGFIQQHAIKETVYYDVHDVILAFARQQLRENYLFEEVRKRLVAAVVTYVNAHAIPDDEAHQQALLLEIDNIFGAAFYTLENEQFHQFTPIFNALARVEEFIKAQGYQRQWIRLKTMQTTRQAALSRDAEAKSNTAEIKTETSPLPPVPEQPDPSLIDTDVNKPAGLQAALATQISTSTALIVRNDLQMAYDEAALRQDRSEMARLALALGSYYADKNDADQSLKYFRQAVTSFQEIGDLVHLLEALEKLAIYSLQLESGEEAQKLTSRALNIAQQLGDDETRGRLLGVMGDVRGKLGDSGGSIEAYKQSIKILRLLNDTQTTGITLSKLATLYLDRHRYREAAVALSQAISLFEQIGRRDLQGRALGNLGTALGHLERWQEAGQRHAAAMRIARDLGDQEEERFQLQNLAFVAESEGYLNWAVNYNRQALYLALLENEEEAVNDLIFEIARLLVNDPEGLAQAEFMLEHAIRVNARPEAMRLLNEVRVRLSKLRRVGRPVTPAETDLYRYAATAYPTSGK